MTRAYKKCLDETRTKFVLVELEIPETATYFTPAYMSSPVYSVDGTKQYEGVKNEPPKTRCSEAKVIKIHGGGSVAYSMVKPTFEYKVGETVKPEKFDPISEKVCSEGIHCFFNKEDAVKYYSGGMLVIQGETGSLVDISNVSRAMSFKLFFGNEVLMVYITDAIVDTE